jgi:lysophospholipase L1-like esterase
MSARSLALTSSSLLGLFVHWGCSCAHQDRPTPPQVAVTESSSSAPRAQVPANAPQPSAPAALSAPAATPAPTLSVAPLDAEPSPEPPAAPALAKAATPTREKAPCRVAVIGDSLSDPRVGGGGYVRFLEHACPNSKFSNFAKGGSMLAHVRKQYDQNVAPKPPGTFTHLIVFAGVNDVYSDETAFRTPEKIQRDLGKLYQRAKHAEMRVVALTIAPWGGFSRYFTWKRGQSTREVNDWIRGRPDSEVNVVVDAFRLLSCGNQDRLCPRYEPPFTDGIHFGKAGQEVLGQALLDAEFSGCS